MGHAINKDCARTTLGAVTTDFCSGKTKLVPERHRQCLLRNYINTALLTVNGQRYEPFNCPRSLRQRNTMPIAKDVIRR